MPLFYCKWPDQASVVIDGTDETKAIEIATELGDAQAPSEVRAIPPNVVAWVASWEPVDDEKSDEEEFVLEPLDHVLELFEKYEEDELPALCTSEAEDDDGAVVRCSRIGAHETHQAANGLEW